MKEKLLRTLSLSQKLKLPELPTKIVYPEIGLALGSGGIWGMAHVGSIKAILEYLQTIEKRDNVKLAPPSFIVGSSAGSIITLLYGIDHSDTIDEKLEHILLIEEVVGQLDYKYVLDLSPRNAFNFFIRDLVFKSTGFMTSNKLKTTLQNLVGCPNIEDLYGNIGFVANKYGENIPTLFTSGPALEILSASFATPLVFKPVNLDGINYSDGGITAPVPGVEVNELMESKGVSNKLLIGLNVGLSSEKKDKTNKNKPTGLLNVSFYSPYLGPVNYLPVQIEKLKKEFILLNLTGDARKGLSLRDFLFNGERIKEIVELGYKNTKENLQIIDEMYNSKIIKVYSSNKNKKPNKTDNYPMLEAAR